MLCCEEHINRRHHEEGEEGADEHDAHQHETDGVTGGGAGLGDEGQGKVTGNGGGARHKNRSQSGHGRFTHGLQLGVALQLQPVSKTPRSGFPSWTPARPKLQGLPGSKY